MALQEKILEIIQKNYNEHKGSNEAELHASEEIAGICIDLAFACSAGYIIASIGRNLTVSEFKELRSNIITIIDESLEESYTKQDEDEQSN